MMPTGSGKTILSCMVMDSLVRNGNTGLFVAARRELVYQKSAQLKKFGIRHGVIMAGESTDWNAPVQVASLQTLHARCIKNQKERLPKADVVTIDEAHGAGCGTYRELLGQYKDSLVLGLSATPARGDGTGLGDIFDRIVIGATYQELREQGFIVPLKVYAPYDEALLKALGGRQTRDFTDAEAAEIVYRPRLVGRIVEHWKSLCSDRLTAAFCSTIAHAQGVREEFTRAGVEADVIHSRMDKRDRREIMRAFTEGEIRVLCNVDVLTEGVDIPPASCAILARPTRSVIRYRQAVGRILRPSPGKVDAVVLDHAGAVYGLGFPDSDIDWPLEGEAGKLKKKDGKDGESGQQEIVPTICKKCGYAWVKSNYAQPCPACGNAVGFWTKKTQTEDGYLTEIQRDGETVADNEVSKLAYWRSMLEVCRHKGYDFWRAGAMFKSKYKHYPPGSYPGYPPSKGQWSKKVADVLPKRRMSRG